MLTLDAAIAGVMAGPKGPGIGAFFDFDGTLIDGYSVTEFFKHRLRQGEIGLQEAAQLLLRGLRGIETEADFEQFVAHGFRAFKGKTLQSMEALGEQLFRDAIARSLFPEAWQLIDAHRRMQHTLVIATSATRFQVAPLARELGIEQLLCTGAEVRDGVLTGRMAGAVAWGTGKARAVRRFAPRHGIDLGRSYGYANGNEDVPFLQVVGLPRAVNPQPRLSRAAAERGWPVLQFAPRGGRPDATTIVRTLAAYAGMAFAAAAGITAGLLNGDRREAVNLATALTSEVGLALAGVELRVQGEEHLWSHRPAVFLFNHQSQLDVLILGKLLRQDFTGIAKMHTRKVPGFGQFFEFAGVAFVEPGLKEQNRKALEPAVAKLKSGISLAVAPEGTRSATPRLGPFRKGAFHIAMQAGAPLVPIVIRNAGELVRRGEAALRAGTVDVVVLPPVATSRWKVADLERHVAAVRQRYLDTLEQWPKAPMPRRRAARARNSARLP